MKAQSDLPCRLTNDSQQGSRAATFIGPEPRSDFLMLRGIECPLAE
jgi:hypothetical protein